MTNNFCIIVCRVSLQAGGTGASSTLLEIRSIGVSYCDKQGALCTLVDCLLVVLTLKSGSPNDSTKELSPQPFPEVDRVHYLVIKLLYIKFGAKECA